MDLTLRTDGNTYTTDDLRWLGSKHAVDTARSVTITGLVAANFDDGFVPSGTPLAEDAATGAVTVATAGDVAGFLLAPLRVREGQTQAVGALLDHGRVVVDLLPVDDPEAFFSPDDGVTAPALVAPAGVILVRSRQFGGLDADALSPWNAA